ncbi:MAG: YjfB family protein [Negativicutes bacterium]|nr:YjfB family protein [Negativicutes bacterium]MDR3590735.1 YjfB family protein [Negativicutes bacterium]
MNPVGLSSVISMAQNNAAGTMVMKKALNTFQQDGNNLVQQLAQMVQSVQPNLGKNVDINI